MEKLGYASYRGKVYKKNDQARHTYSYKCEARAFVNTLATNEFFKSRLLRKMKRVIDLLSNPFCELFSPLIINYDLIEVKDGRCWSISRRDFVEDAIEEQQAHSRPHPSRQRGHGDKAESVQQINDNALH